MKLTNKELIEEFTEESMKKYPDVKREQYWDICFGPWRFLADEMKSGRLSTVRFKYFGTFQVYIGRAKYMLHDLKRRAQFNKINITQYYRLKDMLENFLNREEKTK